MYRVQLSQVPPTFLPFHLSDSAELHWIERHSTCGDNNNCYIIIIESCMCIYNNIIVRIGTEEINAVILHSNIIFIKKFSLLNLLWEDYNNYYTVFITGLYI